ncbi:MAG: extradiol dioxygenase [Gemmatimonadota bacterium]
MITGIHTIVYSAAAEETRAFFRDAMKLSSVDAGRGWLIFAMPPMELAVHPADETAHPPAVYLMCDDLDATLVHLGAHGADVTSPIQEQRWGKVTSIRVPGNVELGIYQPYHPTALSLAIGEAASSRARQQTESEK